MIGYIYKTTNKVNNKIYVGQKKSDKFLGESYLGSGKILTQAVAKYGKEMFNVEMIDTADSLQELGEKEQYWIRELRSQDPSIGYNITPGGIHVPIEGEQNGFYGKHHTEETKRYLSEVNKNRQISQATRDKISAANMGSHRSEETKKKMGYIQKGRKTYTDGKVIRYFFPEKDEIPEGFYPGIPEELREKHRELSKNQVQTSEKGKKCSENNYKRWANYTEEEYEQVCQNMREACAKRSKVNNYWKGKKRPSPSKETRDRLSKNSRGRVWVHKDSLTKMVHSNELETYFSQGFLLGRK